jgi:HJR/Mrr/RecB family endonuclease
VEFVPFSLLSQVVARPKTLFDLTSRTFEQFVAELVSRLGIDDVLLTPERADGGRDVIGTKRVLGIPLIFAFECKRYAPGNPVSVETARALLGTITHGDYRADRGVLVTTSRFTDPARKFIVTSPLLESRDFNGIVEWLKELANLQQGKAN